MGGDEGAPVKKGSDPANRPCKTIAMGMKPSRVSMDCWRATCQKEAKITQEWKTQYCPDLIETEKRIAADVHRRDEEKRAQPRPPEFSLLAEGVSKDGKGRKAYLKERWRLNPQDRYDTPATSSQSIGWRSVEIPPPRPEGLPSYGHRPVIQNGFFRRTLGGSLSPH